MATAELSKDEKNTQAVLDKIAGMPDTMLSVHEVITETNPGLKPRIWYGMPGYARSASSPVLLFFRFDELMTFGLTEKANLSPNRSADGYLIPSAWYFEDLDQKTRERIAEIVKGASQ